MRYRRKHPPPTRTKEKASHSSATTSNQEKGSLRAIDFNKPLLHKRNRFNHPRIIHHTAQGFVSPRAHMWVTKPMYKSNANQKTNACESPPLWVLEVVWAEPSKSRKFESSTIKQATRQSAGCTRFSLLPAVPVCVGVGRFQNVRKTMNNNGKYHHSLNYAGI